MKRTLSATIFLLCLWSLTARAQKEVPVGMYTGTPHVSIPLHVVQDHDLRVPVQLTYSASGVKVDESAGDFGIGWQLEGVGYISREVNGLPDDYKNMDVIPARKGWLVDNTAVNLGNETFQDGATGDWETLDEYAYNLDTEPDLFSIKAPGLSGKFVFDKNGNPQLIPYQKVKIEVTKNNEKILSFKVTTDAGIEYFFDKVDRASKKITKTSLDAVEFNTKEYEQYKDIWVDYNTTWNLSWIKSFTGAKISYSYTSLDEKVSENTPKFWVYDSNTESTFVSKTYYKVENKSLKLRLTEISSSTADKVSFSVGWWGKLINSVNISDVRKSGTVKRFSLSYQSVKSSGTDFYRRFLYQVQETSSCNSLPPYQFSYFGVNYASGETLLPPAGSNSVDFWGYYNGRVNEVEFPTTYVYYNITNKAERYRVYPKGSDAHYIIPGADRNPNPNTLPVGTLDVVTYPTGGKSQFIYEANTFFDPAANKNFTGGGLRIKKIITSPLNGSAVITNYKKYEYTDLGNSSGRLFNVPIFATPVPFYRHPGSNAETKYTDMMLWKSGKGAHVFTKEPVNKTAYSSGSIIGYKKVTVSQGGDGDYAKGKAVYEYYMPGIYSEDLTYEGKKINSTVYTTTKETPPVTDYMNYGGMYTNEQFTYPFFLPAHIDFERGLLKKTTLYNSENKKVQEQETLYKKLYKPGSTSAGIISAVSYESIPYYTNQAFRFASINYITSLKIEPEKVTTTYYSDDETKSLTEVVDYTYGGTRHRYPTDVVRTNSMLSGGNKEVFRQHLRYPEDYNTSGLVPDGDDDACAGLLKLVTTHRLSTPVETVQYKKMPGETVEKVTSAQLATFRLWDGQAAPFQQYQFVSTNGTTDFTLSYTNTTTGHFIFDSDYEKKNRVLAYSANLKPASFLPVSKVVGTKLFGYGKTLPVAEIVNALPGELVFSNFEQGLADRSFQVASSLTGGPVYAKGRTGERGVANSFTLSSSLYKGGSSYVLSGWAKYDESFDFTYKIKDGVGTELIMGTLSYVASGNAWKYFEKVIDVSSYSSNLIIEVIVQRPLRLGDDLPDLVFDDVAFYPADAEISTVTYRVPFGVSSLTDSRGNTGYTYYDGLGRVRYGTDQEGNVIGQNYYKIGDDPRYYMSAAFSVSEETYVNEEITFQANQLTCNDEQFRYFWSLDDGVTFVEGEGIKKHTFTAEGGYGIKLRVEHPLYGSREIRKGISVTKRPIAVSICAEGIRMKDVCGNDQTTYYSCDAIADYLQDGYTTKFKVTAVAHATSTYSYDWQKSYNEGGSWTSIATTQEITITESESYWVRCKITDSSSNTGISDYLSVQYYQSTADCPGGLEPVIK